MRILIYGINYAPELVGVGKYTAEMAKWLADKGHLVRVVTAPPYYPAWRVGKGYSAWQYRREILSAIAVHRCPVWVPHNPSGLRRILHLASFALSSLPQMLRQVFWLPDVVFVVVPTLFCLPVALLTARLCRAVAWLHIQDFEIDSSFALGILPPSTLRRLGEAAESWLFRKFDRVSTISERMLDRLTKKGVELRRQVLFRNWVDTKAVYPLGQPSQIRKELHLPKDAIVALYSGTIGEKHGLEIVIEAARMVLDQERIAFVLCGNGSAYSRIRQLSKGLRNVHWIFLQPLARLNQLLNLADIHLLPQRAQIEDTVMPSKLAGMLASGRPIVAAAHEGTQVAQVLEKTGLRVAPGDSYEFAVSVKRLANNQRERNSLGAEARKYAMEKFDKEMILSHFERCLLELRKTSHIK
jgi:colanic acid biosynthesis glycosyl transferase WcaI